MGVHVGAMVMVAVGSVVAVGVQVGGGPSGVMVGAGCPIPYGVGGGSGFNPE